MGQIDAELLLEFTQEIAALLLGRDRLPCLKPVVMLRLRPALQLVDVHAADAIQRENVHENFEAFIMILAPDLKQVFGAAFDLFLELILL